MVLIFEFFVITEKQRKKKKKEKMFKSTVLLYEGERLVGEVEMYGEKGVVWGEKLIRISHYSPSSERCPPLAVLHTVTTGLSFKLEPTKSKPLTQDSPLTLLHSTCLRDNKCEVEKGMD